MRRVVILGVILFVGLAWLTIRPLLSNRSLGTRENPLQLVLTPSVDAREILRNGDSLASFIQQRTGLYVRVSVPSDYITVVEAFGTSRADVAIMNTFSYLLANAKYGATARLRVVRRNGEITYRGEFIVRDDSGIRSLRDLHGKTMAYVDPSSTSGYIYPKEMLIKEGVVPKEEMFAKGHNQVVLKVYQGDVDAGAVFYSPPDAVTGELLDARCKIMQEHPDVFKEVRILALTNTIPNDPVVMRKGLPVEMQDKVIAALLEFQKTPQGTASLRAIASVDGFVATDDAAYNEVRRLVDRHGVNIEASLKKKR